MSQGNADVIDGFYRAFAERDAAAMAACYHPEIHFSDPVFPELRGPQAGAMWAMLCERGADLEVVHSGVTADGDGGSAHWDATYSFGPKKRVVRNSIDATFEFADGLIIRHIDTFDLWAWTRMALGVPGVFLGWSPLLRSALRKKAGADLLRYINKREQAAS